MNEGYLTLCTRSGASRRWWWWLPLMPRGSCQLSLQRTGDHEDDPTSHGWASYIRIWDPTISHCLKQWIWPRTGLCIGCGRHTALRNLELHARNDDNDRSGSHVALCIHIKWDFSDAWEKSCHDALPDSHRWQWNSNPSKLSDSKGQHDNHWVTAAPYNNNN